MTRPDDLGSVIVSCTAFDEIAREANPALGLGVYLTLTRKWAHRCWAPLSTHSPASGLIGGDG